MSLKERLAQVRERLAQPSVARDAGGLFGGWMIMHGAGQVYAPAGYIVGGVMLVAAALLLARAES